MFFDKSSTSAHVCKSSFANVHKLLRKNVFVACDGIINLVGTKVIAIIGRKKNLPLTGILKVQSKDMRYQLILLIQCSLVTIKLVKKNAVLCLAMIVV